jgi:hypothetical protein
MFISEFLTEDRPKIRKVTKVRPDDTVETTYEILNSQGQTVKTGLSKSLAAEYLKSHYPELMAEAYVRQRSAQ